MIHEITCHIDEEIISRIGLRPSNKLVGPQLTTNARVYEFPTLENVFIMENDLYGNPMPEGFCFLAFPGKHGLIGRRLQIQKLRNYSVSDVQKMVESIEKG